MIFSWINFCKQVNHFRIGYRVNGSFAPEHEINLAKFD